jgi:hypothetical protein
MPFITYHRWLLTPKINLSILKTTFAVTELYQLANEASATFDETRMKKKTLCIVFMIYLTTL